MGGGAMSRVVRRVGPKRSFAGERQDIGAVATAPPKPPPPYLWGRGVSYNSVLAPSTNRHQRAKVAARPSIPMSPLQCRAGAGLDIEAARPTITGGRCPLPGPFREVS